MAHYSPFCSDFSNSTCPSWCSIIAKDVCVKYRLIELSPGRYAIEKMSAFLWWTWGSNTFLDLDTPGFCWSPDMKFFERYCVCKNREEMLDLVDQLNYKRKVIERSALEKPL